MEPVRKLEKSLEQLFKGAPKLSAPSIDSVVWGLPWIALIFGVLQLYAAWVLWGLIGTLVDIGEYSSLYVNPPASVTSSERMIMYLGVGVLFVNAVILLMAYPELKARTRRGWELVFLAAILNVVYAVLSLAIYGRGFGDFIIGLVCSGVGFYLLFQVKAKYKASGEKPADKTK